MMKRTAAAVCGAAVLAAGMTGCGAGFEGSGSKDAASAEQLAMRLDDPWAQEVQADQGSEGRRRRSPTACTRARAKGWRAS